MRILSAGKILTKWLKKRQGKGLKTNTFSTLINLLLSSRCKGGFQKVLNWTSKGR